MQLSELQHKSVVNMQDGKNIGNIVDIKIDPKEGHIISLVLEEGKRFFGHSEGIEIRWHNIEKIGEDVILVRMVE